MEIVAVKPDQTVYDGEGGAYHAWSSSQSPLLAQFKHGAGKLLLHPRGFAHPHYSDSSKIAYVLQGNCTVGLVPPNSSEEKVVAIGKGDVIPLSKGAVSWWFNGGDADLTVVFLGETASARVSGEFTYFFLAGVQGILRGLESDAGKIFDLDNTEAADLANSQTGDLIVQLGNGIEFPNPSEGIKEKIYGAIDTPAADVVVKGGGIVNSLTERDIPAMGGMGLSARFVRLEGGAVLAPSYVADGSVRVVYVAKGSGRIRVVGSEGKAGFNGEVGEGELLIVPQFNVSVEIADEGGMEIFTVITSSKPTFSQLAGNMSVWKALSPVVLRSALNINSKLEKLFKSNNSKL